MKGKGEKETEWKNEWKQCILCIQCRGHLHFCTMVVSLNQCHLLTPHTGQLTATAYSPIRWTRLDWGSFVTNKEIIENSQKTWEVSCTGPLNEAWLDRTVHQIFYNFFFISTHYVLFDMLLPGRWIGRLRFET